MSGFWAIFKRDVALGFRAGGGAALGMAFFALTILIFALAIGPEPILLGRIAAPVLWTASLLSALVSLDRIFQADYEDGSLDLIVETADPVELAFLAKAFAHWVTASAPLIALTPVLGLMLALDGDGFSPLIISLAIGTPALSLIGALAAALTVCLRRANVLTTLLATPLFTPIIIFGVGAASAGATGDPAFTPSLLFLGAASLFSLIVAPFAGAAAIRANLG